MYPFLLSGILKRSPVFPLTLFDNSTLLIMFVLSINCLSLEFGIIPPIFETKDFHVHVPEGATPKDGPSAGIGITTAIISSLTGIPVHSDVAMTGEITLRGEVLPIGGLKEKLLAAHRGNIKKILIPEQNLKDLIDIPDEIKDGVDVIPVKWIDQVIEIALTKEPKSLIKKSKVVPTASKNIIHIDKSIAH